MTFFEELEWRGLVKDMSSPEIEKLLNDESVTFYWGTDPTAPSLHLGHYSSLVTAKRLAKHGHKPILLCGGATGLIGDPRPTAEREIISYEKVQKNFEGIKKQVTDLFHGNVDVVNNYDWFKEQNDPYLESYILKAVQNNNDIKTAQLKIEQAQINVLSTRSDQLPNLSIGAAPAVAKLPNQTKTTGSIALPIIAQYELDLFGKNWDKTKSSKQLLKGVEYQTTAADISIISLVATTYYNIVKLD